jgi:hypothetical protein
MVRIVTFSRNTVAPPPALMGMLPAVNRNYFNPAFFTADSTGDLEPREEILIHLKSSNIVLYKYFGFVDSMLTSPSKTMAIRVVNWHGTKKIQITKGMTLEDLFSCPFIESQFCVIRCRDLADETERPTAVVVPMPHDDSPEDPSTNVPASILLQQHQQQQQQQQPQELLSAEIPFKKTHRRWLSRQYVH